MWIWRAGSDRVAVRGPAEGGARRRWPPGAGLAGAEENRVGRTAGVASLGGGGRGAVDTGATRCLLRPSSRRWQPELDPRQPEQGHGGRGAFCESEV
jgi:hypothetical protein